MLGCHNDMDTEANAGVHYLDTMGYDYHVTLRYVTYSRLDEVQRSAVVAMRGARKVHSIFGVGVVNVCYDAERTEQF